MTQDLEARARELLSGSITEADGFGPTAKVVFADIAVSTLAEALSEADKLRETLKEARARIECEDYVGTCGCSSKVCECKIEHDDFLAKISKALEATRHD